MMKDSELHCAGGGGAGIIWERGTQLTTHPLVHCMCQTPSTELANRDTHATYLPIHPYYTKSSHKSIRKHQLGRVQTVSSQRAAEEITKANRIHGSSQEIIERQIKNTLRQGRPLKKVHELVRTLTYPLSIWMCMLKNKCISRQRGKVDGYNLLESKYTCPLLPSPAKGLHEARDHKISTCLIYLSWKWHTT